MKNKRAVIIAIILGVFAVFAHNTYINRRVESIIGPYEKLPVVIATKDIDMNTRVDSTMLSLDYIPKKFVQPSSVSTVDEAVGYLAAVTIKQGEQILNNKLVSYDESFLAVRIPEGKRAVTLAVNDVTGVAGLPKPGNFVDIIVTYDFGKQDVVDKRTQTLFQNVLVLAIGKDYKFISNPMGMDGKVDDKNQTTVKNVTIALPPREVQRIVLAQQVGLLTVSLRPHFEEPIIETLPEDNIYSVTGTKEPLKSQQRAPYMELRGGSFSPGF